MVGDLSLAGTCLRCRPSAKNISRTNQNGACWPNFGGRMPEREAMMRWHHHTPPSHKCDGVKSERGLCLPNRIVGGDTVLVGSNNEFGHGGLAGSVAQNVWGTATAAEDRRQRGVLLCFLL